MTCRICLEKGGETYCNCKGTMLLVHRDCLQQWLKVSNKKKCEICNAPFLFEPHEFHLGCTIQPEDIYFSNDRTASWICTAGCFTVFGVNFVISTVTSKYLEVIVCSNILVFAASFASASRTNTRFLLFALSTCISCSTFGATFPFKWNPNAIAFATQMCLNVVCVIVWTVAIICRSSWKTYKPKVIQHTITGI